MFAAGMEFEIQHRKQFWLNDACNIVMKSNLPNIISYLHIIQLNEVYQIHFSGPISGCVKFNSNINVSPPDGWEMVWQGDHLDWPM